MWNGKQVSIVLPAYNEAPGISMAIRAFQSTGLVDEIVVVDNNSTDGTFEQALQAGARVVLEKRQGYGWALQRGMSETRGELIVLCEPDGTFEARDIQKLLAYSEDFDMVLGTRTTQELILQDANMKPVLRLGNLIVAKLLELLFGGPSLSDCGCTFRLLNRSAYDEICRYLTIGGSHFLPEMVIYGLIQQQRMIEIPVNYRGRVGTSKITGTWGGTVRTALNMIGLILSTRWRASFHPHYFKKGRLVSRRSFP